MISTNIVTVAFNGKREAYAARSLYQWDYGQILKITDLDLPAAYQVHFATAWRHEALVVLGNEDGVSIPDTLLQEGRDIFAFVYLQTGQDDGETVRMVTIPVKARQQPSEETPTPAQQSALDEAIAALNAAEEGIPDTIEAALAEAKASGEFDGPQGPQGPEGPAGADGTDGADGAPGADGNSVWNTTRSPSSVIIPGKYVYAKSDLHGRSGVDPQIGDIVIESADKVWWINELTGVSQRPVVQLLGSIKGETGETGPAGQDGAPGADGEDGYSPTVTVTTITGGHRVTITDAEGDHVFDVMDGAGGEAVEHQIGAKASQWQRLTVGRANSGDLIGTSGYRYEQNSTRISTKPPVSINGATQISFTVQSGYKFCAYFFNADLSTMLGGNSWTAADDVLTVPSGASYVVVSIAKTSDGTITTDDYDKVEIIGKFELVPFVEDLADAVENGTGGSGGTSDYADLTNKPQINSVTLSGNKTAADLGLAPAGAYVKPSGGIPASDLASAVQTSLGKADSALQSYTETDPTVPSWAKAASKPSYTASEVGAIAAPSSPATGAFLVWDGSAWVAQTLATWQGGNY